jgi:hypothetical protein
MLFAPFVVTSNFYTVTAPFVKHLTNNMVILGLCKEAFQLPIFYGRKNFEFKAAGKWCLAIALLSPRSNNVRKQKFHSRQPSSRSTFGPKKLSKQVTCVTLSTATFSFVSSLRSGRSLSDLSSMESRKL